MMFLFLYKDKTIPIIKPIKVPKISENFFLGETALSINVG